MAATLTISLNDSLKAYVEAQASCGDYGTPSEYVQELIADDRERKSGLKAQLLSALHDDKDSLKISSDDWEHEDLFAVIEEHADTLA